MAEIRATVPHRRWKPPFIIHPFYLLLSTSCHFLVVSFDFKRIWEGKRALSERLTTSPIAEKLRLLDALRERAVTIRASSFQQTVTVQKQPPDYGKNS